MAETKAPARPQSTTADVATPRNPEEAALFDRARRLRRAGKATEARALLKNVVAGRVREQIQRDGLQVGPVRVPGPVVAAVQGAGNGMFGLGDYAAAAGASLDDALNGRPVDYGANVREQSEVRRGVAADNPAAAIAGEVVGGLTTLPAGGAAARAAGGVAARVAPNVVNAIARFAAPATNAVDKAARGGATAALARAVVRTAPAAAVTGGVQGAANGYAVNTDAGDAARGAAVGAGTGAVVGTVLPAAVNAVRPVVGAVADRFSANNALRVLAPQIDVPAARAAANNFAAHVGDAPALAQVVDPAVAREAGGMVARSAPASQAASTAAEGLRNNAQTQVAEVLVPGATGTGGATAASRAVTRRFKPVLDQPVNVGRSGTVIDFLNHPDVVQLINGPEFPSSLRGVLRNAVDFGTPINVQALDSLRQALSARAGPGGAFAYNDLAAQATRIANGRTGGAYGRFLSAVAQGNERQGLAEKALSSASGAESVARKLANSTGTRRDLQQLVGPAEQERLQGLGASVVRSADNLEAIAPTPVRTTGDDERAGLKLAAKLTQAGRLGGAAMAGLAAEISNIARTGPGGTARLAQDLLDPQRAPAVLDMLERIGVGKRTRTAIIEALGVSAGRAAGGAVATGDVATVDTPAAPAQAPEAPQASLQDQTLGLPEEEVLAMFDAAADAGDDDKAGELADIIKTRRASAAATETDLEQELLTKFDAAADAGDDVTAGELAKQIKQLRAGRAK